MFATHNAARTNETWPLTKSDTETIGLMCPPEMDELEAANTVMAAPQRITKDITNREKHPNEKSKH